MYGQCEICAGSHARAIFDAEGPFRDLIHHMHRHRAVDARKAAVVNVVVRAVAGLFGGLEKEFDSACELFSLGSEELGCAKEHRGMAVMTAGVHHAFVFRAVRKLILLGDRKCVDIGAQQHGLPLLSAAQGADEAVVVVKAGDFDAEGFELLLNVCGGLFFMKGQLRMLMLQAAVALDLGEQRKSFIIEIHKFSFFDAK